MNELDQEIQKAAETAEPDLAPLSDTAESTEMKPKRKRIDSQTEFTCPDCGMGFSKKFHKKNGAELIVCEQCNATFAITWEKKIDIKTKVVFSSKPDDVELSSLTKPKSNGKKKK